MEMETGEANVRNDIAKVDSSAATVLRMIENQKQSGENEKKYHNQNIFGKKMKTMKS